MKLTTVFLISFLTLIGCQSHSNLKLPALIGDNMLLQQKTTAKIWGKASPGNKINVSASWNYKGRAIAGKDGKWMVNLTTPEAGGPYTIAISANDTTITVKNVLIGEVWFCSGQSNMEMPLAGWPPVDTIMHSASTIASASIPEIRLFTVQQFSATAFFFGEKLYNELHVPIGLIESAWGGTPSESWTSSESLEKTGEF